MSETTARQREFAEFMEGFCEVTRGLKHNLVEAFNAGWDARDRQPPTPDTIGRQWLGGGVVVTLEKMKSGQAAICVRVEPADGGCGDAGEVSDV